MPNLAPYRHHANPGTPSRQQSITYAPGLGVGPVASAALAALTLVALLQRDERVPSVASCTTAQTEAERCLVLDGTESTAAPLRCDQAIVRLDGLLERRGVFVNPEVHARTTLNTLPRRIVPVESATFGIPSRFGFGNRTAGAAAAFEPPRTTSASDGAVARTWPAIAPGPDGSVTPADARTLFAACVLAPTAEREARTVTVSVFRRDDRRGWLVAALVFAAALLWTLRRRTAVEIDSARGVLEVHEHRWLLHRATRRYPLSDIANVRLATAAVGPFAATRLELVTHAGKLHPLVDVFTPLTRREQERTAERLRSALLPDV
jgi:hypothetical protein